MRKFIRTFIIDQHGAVSVYLIIVVICLFFFNAVLIDYARILVAERQTENAAKAAVRSTMASFDPAIHQYGLFGLKDPHPTATFRKVFSKNLSIQQPGFFHFVDTKMVKGKTRVTINHEKMLSDTYTFKHQILEDMKYRAPIQFTSSIIDGFLQVSNAMEQASAFADIASNIDKKARNRKKDLDSAKNDLTQAKSKLEKMKRPVGGASSAKFPTVNTLGDIVKDVGIYQKIISPKRQPSNVSKKPKYTRIDARKFQRNAEKLVTGLNIAAQSVRTDLQHAISEINEAGKQNQLIKTTIAKKRKQKKGDYSAAKSYERKYGKQTGALSATENHLKKANQKLDDYVMKDSYFTISRKKIESALGKLYSNKRSSLLSRLSHLDSIVSNLDLTDQQRLLELQKGVHSSYDGALVSNGEAISYFEKQRKTTYINKNTQEKQDQANQQEKGDKKNLDLLMNKAKNVAGDTQVYKTLKKLVDKYNGQAGEKPIKVNFNDPTDTSKDAMAMMDKLFHQLGQAMKSERNKIYINEYILTRFKSHDFNIKGTAANNFKNNQVEYIIYGLNAHGANYAAALSELFVIRFAINFLAAFTDAKVDSTGPFIFWAALFDALANTVANMVILTKGEPIKLISKIRYYTDYKDYLRLFLFMHPRGSQLQRTMAVIDHNTKTDLEKRPTYITGKATSSIHLWFLPGITKMLGKVGVINGKVKGGSLDITKTAAYSY